MVVDTRTVVARAAVRLVAGVATVVAMLLLFQALAPALDRAIAVGISIAMAIAASALVEAAIWRIPVSVGFLIVRAAAAGLVAALVLSYLDAR